MDVQALFQFVFKQAQFAGKIPGIGKRGTHLHERAHDEDTHLDGGGAVENGCRHDSKITLCGNRQITNMKQRMKESYGQGDTHQPDPESCGGVREGAAEAFDRGRCGRAIEPRNSDLVRTADAVTISGRQHGAGSNGDPRAGSARS